MRLPPASVTSGQVLMYAGLEEIISTEARHPSNLHIPLHAHAGVFLTYFVEGSVLEKMDAVSYICRPGHVLYKPAGTAHSNVYGPEGSRSFSIQIPSELVSSLSESRLLPDRPRITSDPEIQHAVRTILDETDCRNNVAAMICEENLRSIFTRFQNLGECDLSDERQRRRPEYVNRVCSRIESEFRQPPRLPDLALDVDVHPDYLSRSFRQITGSTISEQIRRRRVEHAALRIRTTRAPLSHIALDSGFSDQSHMTRVMKRYLGLTPGALRKLAG